jgi:hypothetical protein
MLGNLKLVPPALVPTMQAFLQTQGLPPGALDSNGEVDPMALFSLAFDTVEVRTAYSEPVTINLNAPQGPPDTATEELLQKIRPALILNGRFGRASVAPYGIPAGFAPGTVQRWGTYVGVGAAALGLLFLIYGYSRKR